VETSAPSIVGLTYIPEYLSAAEQEQLITTVDGLPWLGDLKRRVQHYGYRYDYTRKTVDASLYLGPLPGWAAELAVRFQRDGQIARAPDQLIVNEYLPGQGIAGHVDCVPCFGDTVLSLSLGSACVMTMTHLRDRTTVPLLLEPGSLLVMAGAARYEWKHGIAARKVDTYANQSIVRGRRVSLTFRTVIVSA
jgi:alkylated DNA repair dioxygenase AlkB